jgi:hypothetical protein
LPYREYGGLAPPSASLGLTRFWAAFVLGRLTRCVPGKARWVLASAISLRDFADGMRGGFALAIVFYAMRAACRDGFRAKVRRG